MAEHSIYKQEKQTIEKIEKIVRDEQYVDSPLYVEFTELTENYKKLFRHFSRIVKINDKQQRELFESQEAIMHYNEELKTANATKDKFFSIISHDLKSPINSFLNLSTLLVDYIHKYNKEEIQEMASTVKKSGENLLQLMENLLNWARLQMDRATFEPQPCTLNALVHNVSAALHNSLNEKAIRLTQQIPENMPLHADPNMISFVLQNLISNAAKFTARGGEIILTAKPVDTMVEISVCDCGIGLSKKNLAKLFRIDVIYTNLGTEKEKGTGLGLILCREMVEKHDGRIWADSEEGVGTTFTFTCPVTA